MHKRYCALTPGFLPIEPGLDLRTHLDAELHRGSRNQSVELASLNYVNTSYSQQYILSVLKKDRLLGTCK